jgi:hypothetical protein
MKDAFYSLGIVLTFVIGVWNIIGNYQASRRTVFINTVTAERVKWIEKLRASISAFCGLTHTWRFSDLEGKPTEIEVIKELDRLRYLIRLQLNPNGICDRQIETLIAKIPDLTHDTQEKELKVALNQLVEVTQQLLKDEWEKVKDETKRGDLRA